MNTLELPSANNDVRDAGTVLKDEDGIFAAVLSVAAGHTTIELAVAKVNGTGNDGSLRQSDDAADAAGDIEGLGRGEAASRKDSNNGRLHGEWMFKVEEFAGKL